MLKRTQTADAERVEHYEPSAEARASYLNYLIEEPEMAQALEALASLSQTQRRLVVDFLRQVAPDESLDLGAKGALVRRRAA